MYSDKDSYFQHHNEQKNIVKELKRLNKYFWKYKNLLLAGTMFIVISKLFAVFQAPLVRKSLNLIVEKLSDNTATKNLSWELAEYGAYMVGAAVISGFFLFLTRQTIIVMSRKIEYDMKNEIFEHYLTLSPSFFKRNNTGDLMSRISEDVSKVRMYIGPGVMYGISLVVISVTVISTMLSVNPWLTAIVLIPLPLLSISIYWVSSKLNKTSEQVQEKMASLSTFVQEIFSGIRVIKSFSKEKTFAKQMEKESAEYKKKALDLAKIQASFFPTIIFLIGLSVLLTVYFGGKLTIASTSAQFTPGNIAEFMLYLSMLTWPVTSIGWVTSIIQTASASQKRINEFLSAQSELTSNGNISIDSIKKIEFKDVSFAYEDDPTNYVLKNINLTISQGQKLAVLGETGSGKSTLINLIGRMFDVSKGQILINDINIKELNLSVYRKKLGFVPQDAFLFSDTIKGNLKFGNENASLEAIQRATKTTCVDDSILNFKEGYDTVIGERGVTLSGGQKQRITISRALLNNPEILILDDSLSAVDTNTEHKILTNLKKEIAQKTSLFVSHRVSTTKIADTIMILKKGELVEKGEQQALLQYNSHFKKMYDQQITTE